MLIYAVKIGISTKYQNHFLLNGPDRKGYIHISFQINIIGYNRKYIEI